MANYDSTQLIVALKAYSRANPLSLDSTEVWDSYAEAENYAKQANAYPGQTIKALLEDGKYHEYVLQPSEAGYTLDEVGAIKASDLKQYVIVDTTLPTTGQEQGVIYIETENYTGNIWNGSDWVKVFSDVQPAIDRMNDELDTVKTDLALKAPLANPAFTGAVTVDGEAVAIKSYVDGLFAQLGETVSVPKIANSETQFVDYKAGETYRVAEAGTYCGQVCEVGDLIIVVADYVEGTSSNADFIVVQSNIDGAVTSTADVTTTGELVMFDSVTGKVIASSGVHVASLNEAIAKAHEHENKEVLDSYTMGQDELLAAAQEAAQDLVGGLDDKMTDTLAGKADAATTLEGYGITDAYNKTEVDASLRTITDNLNTKVTGTEVDTKISEAQTEILDTAQGYVNQLSEELTATIDGKADAEHRHDDLYYTESEIDDKLQVITDTVAAKANAADVETLVSETKTATLSEAATAAAAALAARVGEISENTTIKAYVDSISQTGSADVTAAIEAARDQAIATSNAYTDEQMAPVFAALTVTEF